jgi:hypothetical protein
MAVNEVVVRCFGDLGNNAVLQLPGRRFPGVVVQGDTLQKLVAMSTIIHEQSSVGNIGAALEEANLLFDSLNTILDSYLAVLSEYGIEPPFKVTP